MRSKHPRVRLEGGLCPTSNALAFKKNPFDKTIASVLVS